MPARANVFGKFILHQQNLSFDKSLEVLKKIQYVFPILSVQSLNFLCTYYKLKFGLTLFTIEI